MSRLMQPDCVHFQGSRNRKGYGRKRFNGTTGLAHRWAWEQANGPIPPGMQVLHRCDNPPCINIDHLYLGTHIDNMADRRRRGRQYFKLSDQKMAEIRSALAAGETPNTLAARFGVSTSRIRKIRNQPQPRTTQP
jgi:HNH endonuclease